MRIAVFGLGYVGTVCGACFAADGHEIIGVEVNPEKLALVEKGLSPIVEPGLDELLAEAVASGLLKVTSDTHTAVSAADVSMICVGTPSREDGSLNLDYVLAVCSQIGDALRTSNHYQVVAIRSTVLPGTLERCSTILAERSGKVAGKHFGVASNPEFLRESSAIKDFRNPPYTLVGADDPKAVDVLRRLYEKVDAPFVSAPLRVAEMMKYVNNSYHALKVAFANEVGSVCKALGIDGHMVMDLFCRDEKLNISRAYFRPGFAFGGSCLPKDLRALNAEAARHGVELPVLSHVMESNANHVRNGAALVRATGKRRVGMLGLSFKAGTDDLRESPLVKLAGELIAAGLETRIYDPSVNLAILKGANKAYIEQQLPRISEMLATDIDEVLKHAECIVIGNADPQFLNVPDRLRPDQVVIDLVRVRPDAISGSNYQGICW